MRKLAIILPLIALLAVALGFAVYAWTSLESAAIPTSGYVALGLGVLFSLVVGCGLMGLLFYSSRHGYDDRVHSIEPKDR